VPNDAVQANVQVQLQQSLGCHRVYVLDDGEVDGQDMADSFQLVARSEGLTVVAVQAFERKAVDYSGLARSVAQTGADCVLVSALAESGAALVTKQIAAAMPSARIFGTAGVAENTFTNPALGGIPLELDPRVLLTSPAVGPNAGPPSARSFYAAYGRRYGTPQPGAIYGYEAMSLALDAIRRASDDGRDSVRRDKVLHELFDTRDRQSVLGDYSITGNGDTTIRRYGVYRVLDGQLSYWKTMVG
jgi:branched-chain amino acid transport system substrate-binding protein